MILLYNFSNIRAYVNIFYLFNTQEVFSIHYLIIRGLYDYILLYY